MPGHKEMVIKMQGRHVLACYIERMEEEEEGMLRCSSTTCTVKL